ncbi:hypothetical protein [Amphritea sp.]|uniref:hypothetical protein n=1 Tax=Amphritea sp. TaxID=1872502 RepID=UPI003D103EB4
MVSNVDTLQLEKLLGENGDIDFDALADWAYKTRLDGLGDFPREILDDLEQLGACNMGPEFEWSRQDLRALLGKLRISSSS